MTAPIYVHTLECKPIFDDDRSDARENLEVHGIYASKGATNSAARSLVKKGWDDEQLRKPKMTKTSIMLSYWSMGTRSHVLRGGQKYTSRNGLFWGFR